MENKIIVELMNHYSLSHDTYIDTIESIEKLQDMGIEIYNFSVSEIVKMTHPKLTVEEKQFAKLLTLKTSDQLIPYLVEVAELNLDAKINVFPNRHGDESYGFKINLTDTGPMVTKETSDDKVKQMESDRPLNNEFAIGWVLNGAQYYFLKETKDYGLKTLKQIVNYLFKANLQLLFDDKETDY